MSTLFFKSLKTSLYSLSLASFVVASPQSLIDDAGSTDHYSHLPPEVRLKIYQPLWDLGDINSLFSLSITNKQEAESVTTFICEAVINGRTQACKNPQNYNQLASLFDQGGSLHDNLKSYLQNNPVLIHQGSVLSYILTHVKTNTFQTQLLAENESIYHKVWSSPMEGNDPNGLRNKSILQHLASPFKILTADHQELSKRDCERLSASLFALKAERNYLSLEEAQELAKTKTGMTAKSTFITMNDLELRDPAKKQGFEGLLAQNPELELLLDVGQSFVNRNGVLSMSAATLPQNLRHLTLANAKENATKIGAWFLYRESRLNSLNISGLTALTEIDDWFLYEAGSLNSFNMSGLTGLTKIGDLFLFGASRLNSLNMSDLTGLTEVGDLFFEGATSLTFFDMSGLTGLTEIGDEFLYGASNLGSVNAFGLTSIEEIGTQFLSGTKVNGEKIREEILAKAKLEK